MALIREIVLSNGDVTIVDDVDYEMLLAVGVWHRTGFGYAYAHGPNGRGIRMHRLILGAGRGDMVDHADGDRLNNRRCNLRLASHSQNNANKRRAKNNTSGFKGVYWCRAKQRWHATVMLNRKRHHAGYFESAEQAHHAYVELASKLFGEFVRAQ